MKCVTDKQYEILCISQVLTTCISFKWSSTWFVVKNLLSSKCLAWFSLVLLGSPEALVWK